MAKFLRITENEILNLEHISWIKLDRAEGKIHVRAADGVIGSVGIDPNFNEAFFTELLDYLAKEGQLIEL